VAIKDSISLNVQANTDAKALNKYIQSRREGAWTGQGHQLPAAILQGWILDLSSNADFWT
jgi:hypothetical protein